MKVHGGRRARRRRARTTSCRQTCCVSCVLRGFAEVKADLKSWCTQLYLKASMPRMSSKYRDINRCCTRVHARPLAKKREDYPKAKAELEAEAVPSEPSIRSAEAGLLCWYAASRCHYSQTPCIASNRAGIPRVTEQ